MIIALLAAILSQDAGDSARARTAVERMRSAVFDLEDAVSQARLETDATRRNTLIVRARRLGRAAGNLASQAGAILDRRDSSIGPTTLATLRAMLERNKEWLRRALDRLPAPTDAEQQSQASASLPESVLEQPATAEQPVPTDPDSLEGRARALRQEIELAHAFARDHFDYRKNVGAIREAFARHGAADKHGWASPWADWLYTETWAGICGHRWKSLTAALDGFIAYLGAPRAADRTDDERAYVRYLAGCTGIWRRHNADQHRLLRDVIDLMGRRAAAGEAGDRKTYDALGKSREELLKTYERDFPIQVKPFDTWRESMAASQAELDRLRRLGREGAQLEPAHVRRLLDRVSARMMSRNLPMPWLRELRDTLPDVDYDEATVNAHDAVAVYDTLSNTVHLRPEMNVDRLSDEDFNTLVHEMFHAWHDMVPYWTEIKLSVAEEEAVAGFLGSMAGGGGVFDAFNDGLFQGDTTARVVVEALVKVDRHWKGEFLKKLRFKNEADRNGWAGLKRKDAAARPHLERLEAMFARE